MKFVLIALLAFCVAISVAGKLDFVKSKAVAAPKTKSLAALATPEKLAKSALIRKLIAGIEFRAASAKFSTPTACGYCELVVDELVFFAAATKDALVTGAIDAFCSVFGDIGDADDVWATVLAATCSDAGRFLLEVDLEYLVTSVNGNTVCQALYVCDKPQCYDWQTGTQDNYCYAPINNGAGHFQWLSYENADDTCQSWGGQICTVDQLLRWVHSADLVQYIASAATPPSPIENGFIWTQSVADGEYLATPQSGAGAPPGSRPWAVTGSWEGVSDGFADPIYQVVLSGGTGDLTVGPHFSFQTNDLYGGVLFSDAGSLSTAQQGAVICCRPSWSATGNNDYSGTPGIPKKN